MALGFLSYPAGHTCPYAPVAAFSRYGHEIVLYVCLFTGKEWDRLRREGRKGGEAREERGSYLSWLVGGGSERGQGVN